MCVFARACLRVCVCSGSIINCRAVVVVGSDNDDDDDDDYNDADCNDDGNAQMQY